MPSDERLTDAQMKEWLRELEVGAYSVYVFYGPGEAVLYVGYTGELTPRLKDHAKKKPWVLEETKRIEIHPNLTEGQAHEKEAQLYKDLKPKYNKAPLYTEGELPRSERVPRQVWDGDWWEVPKLDRFECAACQKEFENYRRIRWNSKTIESKDLWETYTICTRCEEKVAEDEWQKGDLENYLGSEQLGGSFEPARDF